MVEPLRLTVPLLKVLDAMLQDPTEQHWGFQLIKMTGLKSGTLYPLLARLERAGWVESGWQAEPIPGRPRRRYYRLTGVGAQAAGRALVESPGQRKPTRQPVPWRPIIPGAAT
jgi:PadR family transcriptional regulator, regulatory protein PadR